jgi:hypothetical protein
LLCRLAQGDDGLDIPIDVEIVPAPAVDQPANFRHPEALALRTTDARLLDAAERAYQGTWPTLKAFLLDRLARALGTHRSELLAHRDVGDLLCYHQERGWLIWSIPVAGAQCMMFELPRTSPDYPRLAALVEPKRAAAACPAP